MSGEEDNQEDRKMFQVEERSKAHTTTLPLQHTNTQTRLSDNIYLQLQKKCSLFHFIQNSSKKERVRNKIKTTDGVMTKEAQRNRVGMKEWFLRCWKVDDTYFIFLLIQPSATPFSPPSLPRSSLLGSFNVLFTVPSLFTLPVVWLNKGCQLNRLSSLIRKWSTL